MRLAHSQTIWYNTYGLSLGTVRCQDAGAWQLLENVFGAAAAAHNIIHTGAWCSDDFSAHGQAPALALPLRMAGVGQALGAWGLGHRKQL